MPCITIDALAEYLSARPEWVIARPFDSIEYAVSQFRKGVPLVVMDDEDRENEGDIIAPAQGITIETVALMVNHTTGIICAPMPAERADTLALNPMLAENE